MYETNENQCFREILGIALVNDSLAEISKFPGLVRKSKGGEPLDLGPQPLVRNENVRKHVKNYGFCEIQRFALMIDNMA